MIFIQKNGNIEKAISFYKKAQDYGLNDVLWKLYFTESTHKTKDKNKSSRLRELLDKAVEESTPSGFYLKGKRIILENYMMVVVILKITN